MGGFTRGLELAGHKCVGHCEFDKFAEASYRSMHTITEEQREYLATLNKQKRQKEILKDEYLNGEWYNSDIQMGSNCLDTRYSNGVSDFGASARGVLLNEDNPREESFKLIINGENCSIGRLTPLECWRLQGWSDNYYKKASQVTAESQLYRQAGNGVTVRIIELLGEKLKELEEE